MGDIILYRDPTKKLLGLINIYSEILGYVISMQKTVAFLYTNNETSEKEKNAFTTISKAIK